MRITELLKKESIELGVKVSSKEEAIDTLIGLMAVSYTHLDVYKRQAGDIC